MAFERNFASYPLLFYIAYCKIMMCDAGVRLNFSSNPRYLLLAGLHLLLGLGLFGYTESG